MAEGAGRVLVVTSFFSSDALVEETVATFGAGADLHLVPVEPDADVPAHLCRDGGQPHLLCTGADDRPLEASTEQLVRRLLHEHQIIELRRYTAQNTHYELQEDRRLEQALIDAEF